MSVIKRTWPYGTTKRVKVLSATNRLIVCADEAEAYLLTRHGLTVLPTVGAWVNIVFTEGGTMGGYWKLVLG